MIYGQKIRRRSIGVIFPGYPIGERRNLQLVPGAKTMTGFTTLPPLVYQGKHLLSFRCCFHSFLSQSYSTALFI